jgi:integrase
MNSFEPVDIRKSLRKLFPETDWKVRKMVLNTQKNSKGEVKIYIEVLKYLYYDTGKFGKEIRRISCEVWVLPQHWSKKKQEVLAKDPEYSGKNSVINEKYLAIRDYINNRELNLNTVKRTPYELLENWEKFVIDFKKIVELFPSNKQSRVKGLTEYLTEYVELRKSTGAARGTWKEFITVKNRLIKYEEHKGKKLFFQDMDLTFSDNFNIWMRTMEYIPSTIEKTFTVLKTFLKHYYKRRKEINIVLSDTFMDEEFKKGKKSANEANPLTLDEFIKLSKMSFESRVFEKTKDRFMLQCSTGLRFSDIDKITPDKIDKGRIKINPTKTQETKEDNTIYIDLNKYSRAILKKYHNDTTSLKISNQKYNDNLEDMFKELKWKKRTSHNGRDTFISICIQKKVPVEVILTWTGQSSYSVMRRYIKVPDDHKKSEMNRAFK